MTIVYDASINDGIKRTQAKAPAAAPKAKKPVPEFEVPEYTPGLAKEMSSLYARVSKVIPSVEWPFFAPYIYEINRLKAEKNAVILAHNYMTPEIFHCVADIAGDSLQLAIEATKVGG